MLALHSTRQVSPSLDVCATVTFPAGLWSCPAGPARIEVILAFAGIGKLPPSANHSVVVELPPLLAAFACLCFCSLPLLRRRGVAVGCEPPSPSAVAAKLLRLLLRTLVPGASSALPALRDTVGELPHRYREAAGMLLPPLLLLLGGIATGSSLSVGQANRASLTQDRRHRRCEDCESTSCYAPYDEHNDEEVRDGAKGRAIACARTYLRNLHQRELE